MAKKSTPAKSKSAAAKKKPATKVVVKKASKTATKKTTAKKPSTPVKKVAATKKASQPKTTAASKKGAAKSTRKASPPASKSTAKSKGASAAASPKTTTGLPITRVSLVKKATPVSFSLEDVEELLKSRTNKAEPGQEADSKPAPTPAATKVEKKPVIEPLPIEKRKHGAASLMDILGFNPSEKKSPIDLAPDEVPAKWKKYYKLLLELRDHVKEELELHTSETLKHSPREDSGDLSGYAQHQADSATDSFDRDFALSLLSSEQDALYEIEEAIKRIRNGAYGRCEVTGEAIPKERLLAVPFTRFSIEGQREFEKNKRRKIERGTAFADNSDGVSLAGDDDEDE
jgi:DnaK suppressor protein